MSRIWQTTAYKLADDNLRSWATQLGYPRFDLSHYMDELTEKPIHITIQTNLGHSKEEIFLKIENNLLKPNLYYFKGNYFLKGKNAAGKRSVFFSEKTFNEHPTIVLLKSKMDEKLKQLYDQHFEELELQIREKLPTTAKMAMMDDIESLIEAADFYSLYAWFVSHDFSNIPSIEQLSRMTDITSIPVAVREDGYGHSCGSTIKIDWKNHTFEGFGWSSDD